MYTVVIETTQRPRIEPILPTIFYGEGMFRALGENHPDRSDKSATLPMLQQKALGMMVVLILFHSVGIFAWVESGNSSFLTEDFIAYSATDIKKLWAVHLNELEGGFKDPPQMSHCIGGEWAWSH